MIATLGLMAALAVACTGDDRQQVTVLAASSMTGAFADLEAAYEARHPDVDVVVSTGGSPSLAAQAAAGSPASVLVTADAPTMQTAVDAGVTTGPPRAIASNSVTVARSADPPGPLVETPADLSGDIVVALCAPEVPCGRAGAALLDGAGLDVTADSLEPSVRAVVTRLVLGEVDVGVVYETDVTASAGDLVAVPLPGDPDEGDTDVSYLAAPLTGGPGGPALVDFLAGDEAGAILAEHGFGPA